MSTESKAKSKKRSFVLGIVLGILVAGVLIWSSENIQLGYLELPKRQAASRQAAGSFTTNIPAPGAPGKTLYQAAEKVRGTTALNQGLRVAKWDENQTIAILGQNPEIESLLNTAMTAGDGSRIMPVDWTSTEGVGMDELINVGILAEASASAGLASARSGDIPLAKERFRRSARLVAAVASQPSPVSWGTAAGSAEFLVRRMMELYESPNLKEPANVILEDAVRELDSAFEIDPRLVAAKQVYVARMQVRKLGAVVATDGMMGLVGQTTDSSEANKGLPWGIINAEAYDAAFLGAILPRLKVLGEALRDPKQYKTLARDQNAWLLVDDTYSDAKWRPVVTRFGQLSPKPLLDWARGRDYAELALQLESLYTKRTLADNITTTALDPFTLTTSGNGFTVSWPDLDGSERSVVSPVPPIDFASMKPSMGGTGGGRRR
jgi:hypothetical protein